MLKLLDRENQSSYQLEILAIDKAEHQPKLTSTTMVLYECFLNQSVA